MCDTFVVVDPGAVWFGKNSDREPGEAQVVQHVARTRTTSARVQATYVDVDQVAETAEVVLSRPAWMWGAEMGANEHGLAIGNEAVFTKLPVARTGLLGMDLVRLALERCTTAEAAVDLIAWMLERHGQGGPAGYRHKRFAYHNAFVIADPSDAWILETAGRAWAAERVTAGVRTTSNVLTIGEHYTRIGATTIELARAHGWLKRGASFDFRRCFANPVIGALSGGDVRRACTARALAAAGPRALATVLATVRDHGGHSVRGGMRMLAPCAHASLGPTRDSGQTTGTQISQLVRGASRHFFTGTSAPCLSVLKPVPLGRGAIDTGPSPDARGFDPDSLFWRAELLHRTVLRSYDDRRAAFEAERVALEQRALAVTDAVAASAVFAEHRERVRDWTAHAKAVRPRALPTPFDAFWRVQSRRDGLPHD